MRSLFVVVIEMSDTLKTVSTIFSVLFGLRLLIWGVLKR